MAICWPTLTKGALRYVGGALSHEGKVTIATLDAAIGIRGGTATIIQGPNGTEVINGFGTITISNGGGTIVVTRAGFVVTITGWNTLPGQPVRVTAAEIDCLHEIFDEQIRPKRRRRRSGEIQYAACGTPTSQACPEPPWLPTCHRRERRLPNHHPGDAARHEPNAATAPPWYLSHSKA